MIVPNTPRKTLIASLIAASMDPFGLLVAHLRGVGTPGAGPDPVELPAELRLRFTIAVIPSKIMVRLAGTCSRPASWAATSSRERLGAVAWARCGAPPPDARPARGDQADPARELGPATPRRAGCAPAVRARGRGRGDATSPHTVELSTSASPADGTLYFVMELLDGLTWSRWCGEAGPSPAARVIHLLRQVCESLAEAHARGLVHRDIKPANIFICRCGREHDS